MSSADPPTRGWWGDGPAPWDRWPGVSLRLEGTWTGERWESPCGRYWYDPDAAERPERFFRAYLVHVKGEWAGRPFELLPWQTQLVFRPLFGWKRTSDDLRRFRSLFLIVAKKNGKSAIASGLALYLLAADGEPGAEVYSAAADEKQARIVFGDAAVMAEEGPALVRDLGLKVFKRAITQRATNSTYKVLSRAVGTKHGFNLHGLIFDEFHTQKTRDLWDTLYKGTSARRQPVVAVITTAGSDRESICFEQYEYAHRVLDGDVEDDKFLPVVFEIDAEDDDWTDPDVWHKANPSLGVAKRLEYMEGECAQAQAEPRKRNSFLNLDLNVWTESRTVWISPEQFAACARGPGEREPERLKSMTCCVGLDLSATRDLTACVLAFREPDHGPADVVEIDGLDGEKVQSELDYRIHLVEWYWLPEGLLREKVRRDRVPYDVWKAQGWLHTTPGDVVDYGAVERHVLDLSERYGFREAGIDPHNAMHLTSRLLDRGVPMVHVRQGPITLSWPCKVFEALVYAGRVTYSGSPITRWCVSNCEVKTDTNGNISPAKPGGDARGRRRIDGVSATVTALARLLVVPEETGSVYEERGLLVF